MLHVGGNSIVRRSFSIELATDDYHYTNNRNSFPIETCLTRLSLELVFQSSTMQSEEIYGPHWNFKSNAGSARHFVQGVYRLFDKFPAKRAVLPSKKRNVCNFCTLYVTRTDVRTRWRLF